MNEKQHVQWTKIIMQRNLHVSIEQPFRTLCLFWIKMQGFVIEFSKKSKQQSQREEVKQHMTKFKHGVREIKSFMQQMQKMQAMQTRQRMQKMMKNSIKRQNARMKKKEQLKKQREQLKIMKTKKLMKTQSSSHQSSMHKAYFSSLQFHPHFASRSEGNKSTILHSQQIFRSSESTVNCFSLFWINYDCLLFRFSNRKGFRSSLEGTKTKTRNSPSFFRQNNEFQYETF